VCCPGFPTEAIGARIDAGQQAKREILENAFTLMDGELGIGVIFALSALAAILSLRLISVMQRRSKTGGIAEAYAEYLTNRDGLFLEMVHACARFCGLFLVFFFAFGGLYLLVGSLGKMLLFAGILWAVAYVAFRMGARLGKP
jgi:hypothetical protein